MDAALKAFIELVTAVGLIGTFAFLLIWVFVIKQRSDNAARERQDAFSKQMASIVEMQAKNEAAHIEHLALIQQELSILSKTLDNTSAAKQATIEHNARATETLQEIVKASAQALIEHRLEYMARWDEALKKMSGAQDRIVSEVNANVDKRAGEVGEQITGVQRDFTTQHAEQNAGVKALMEESEKRINEHTDQKVDHNGDATRSLIIEQLKSINARLDAMQLKVEQRDSQMAQQLQQLSADLSSILLLITAPKAPPQTLPDVSKKELD